MNRLFSAPNKQFFFFVLLTLLAVGINLFPITFFTGSVFVFGNIVAVAITLVFGWRFGLFCTLFSASIAYFNWGHFLLVLPFTGEIIAVAIAKSRKKSVVLWGLLYWATIGSAIAAIEYYWFTDYLDVVKQAITIKFFINGVLNIVLGYLLALALARFVKTDWRVQLSFNHLISIIILFTLTIGVFANTYFWLESYQQNKLTQINKELNLRSKNITKELELFIDAHINALALNVSLHRHSDNHLSWEKALEETANLYPNILTMLVTDKNGKIIATYPSKFITELKAKNLTVADRGYFKDPKRTLAPFVSDVFEGRGFGNDPIVALSAPIITNGEFQGIIEASLNLDKLNQVDAKHLGSQESILIFDQNNKVIYSSETLPYVFLQNLKNLGVINHINNPQNYHFADFIGNYHIANHHKSQQLNWTAVTLLPRDLFEQEISTYVISSLLFLSLFILLCFLIITRLAKRLSKPISDLSKQLLKVSKNKSYDKLDLTLEPSFLTEINAIKPVINRFSLELSSTISSLNNANHELEEFNHNLEDLVNQKTQELEKALINANAANEAKSEFLATMSHEIRTPMNGVLGMLELLEQTELSSEAKHKIGVAKSSAKSLLNLINDVLDFSKIEAGKLSFEKNHFSLVELLSDIAESHSLSAQNKGLKLFLDGSGINQDWIFGDPYRIRQVLTNIIGNAIKFTTEGFIKIECRSIAIDHEVLIEIKVRDSGIGISEEQQQKLFNPFSQADSSTTRKFGGTGLGLSIANRLCDLMNGGIQLKSTPNIGSEFNISIRSGLSGKPSYFKQNLGRAFSKVVCLVAQNNEEGIIPLLEYWKASLIKTSNVAGFTEVYGRLKKLKNKTHPAMICIDLSFFETCQPLCNEIIKDGNIVIVLCDVSDSIALKGQSGYSAMCNYTITPVSLRHALFTLPTGQQAENIEKQIKSSGGSRVLVVEDNEINTEVTTHMLKNMGIQFSSAENGKIAIEKLISSKAPFDLILMDCQMPEMDGFTATQKIRLGEAGEPYKTIPIIALTANAMAGDRERCSESGMDDYVSKPIEFNILQNVLANYLQISANE